MKRKRIIALILIVLVAVMIIDFRVNNEDVIADYFMQFETESMQNITGISSINYDRDNPAAVRKSNLNYRTKEEIKSFNLDNEMGSIDIKGHDGDQIEVDYEIKIYSNDKEAASRYINQIEVNYEVSNGNFNLYVNRPEKPDNIRGIEVLFDIKAPRDLYLDLANRYGEVEINSFDSGLNLSARYNITTVNFVKGDIEINNDYGSLYLSDLNGNLNIDTSYNKNEFRNLEGRLNFNTQYTQSNLININADTVINGRYGGVNIDGLEGSLDIDTRYTGMTLDEIKGPIRGNLEYGDVNIESLSNELDISSRYSDLKIWMTKDYNNLDVDVTTRYGDLSSDLDLPITSEDSREMISGTIGTGEIPLRIDSSYADVELIYEN
ncbi:MAG: hypothetical protein U5K53_03465 [Halanaerobiales bacterium]|nr:hypothetical protein [Halanaerobiales bacterium]